MKDAVSAHIAAAADRAVDVGAMMLRHVRTLTDGVWLFSLLRLANTDAPRMVVMLSSGRRALVILPDCEVWLPVAVA